MEDKDRLYQNLINILKMFKNRPYHLAKYLIDNKAFNDVFIRKLTSTNIQTKGDNIIFEDINHLNDYYNSLIENVSKEKTPEEIAIEINRKLEMLISEEKYEEAIYIRDYMNKNNIPRINF